MLSLLCDKIPRHGIGKDELMLIDPLVVATDGIGNLASTLKGP